MPAIKSFFGSLFSGHPSDAFDYLFLSQDQVDTTNQVNAHQERLVKEQYERGLLSQEEEMQELSELQGNAFPKLFDDPQNSIGGAFVEGAVEGIHKEQAFVQKATSGVTNTLLGFIPWQAWVLLIVIGIIYGAPIIRRYLK